MSTNDIASLPENGSVRTVLVNEKGKIIDLVSLIATTESVILIGSAGKGTAVADWLNRYIIMDDVHISLRGDTVELSCLVGPGAHEAVINRERIPETVRFVREDIGSISAFTLLGDTDLGEIPRMHEAAFETIRIEEGCPVAGKELTERYNALEAGLREFISFTKGCYIGQEVIARLDTYRKLQRVLSMFEFPGHSDSTLQPGPLVSDGGEGGVVTSTVYSPARQAWIGLGYRSVGAVAGGLFLESGGKKIKAWCVPGVPEGDEQYDTTDAPP
jgi:folate-binding protein YgfZ